jgi:hypothetical protein
MRTDQGHRHHFLSPFGAGVCALILLAAQAMVFVHGFSVGHAVDPGSGRLVHVTHTHDGSAPIGPDGSVRECEIVALLGHAAVFSCVVKSLAPAPNVEITTVAADTGLCVPPVRLVYRFSPSQSPPATSV